MSADYRSHLVARGAEAYALAQWAAFKECFEKLDDVGKSELASVVYDLRSMNT